MMNIGMHLNLGIYGCSGMANPYSKRIFQCPPVCSKSPGHRLRKTSPRPCRPNQVNPLCKSDEMNIFRFSGHEAINCAKNFLDGFIDCFKSRGVSFKLLSYSHCNGGIGATATCAFFFKKPATTEIYTLSLHDALPI